MSAYRDALHIDRDAPPSRVRLAMSLLQSGEGVVVLEGRVALRPLQDHILCEVIDESGKSRRSPHEYEALVEAGRQILATSQLENALPRKILSWLVVVDDGSGTIEMWHAT